MGPTGNCQFDKFNCDGIAFASRLLSGYTIDRARVKNEPVVCSRRGSADNEAKNDVKSIIIKHERKKTRRIRFRQRMRANACVRRIHESVAHLLNWIASRHSIDSRSNFWALNSPLSLLAVMLHRKQQIRIVIFMIFQRWKAVRVSGKIGSNKPPTMTDDNISTTSHDGFQPLLLDF